MRLPRFKDRSNRIILCLLLLLFAGTIGASSVTTYNDKPSYVAFGLILLTGLVGILRRNADGTRAPVTVRLYDLVPLGLLLVWVYGLLLGFAHHNRTEYVVRNFAGMSLYSLYYVMLFRGIKRFDLLRCIMIAAAMNATYMFGLYIWDKLIGRLAAHPTDFVFFDVRSYYAETLALLMAPVFLCVHTLVFPPSGLAAGGRPTRGLTPIAFLYLYLFAFLQIPLSKATLLAFWLAYPLSIWCFRVQLRDLINTGRVIRVWALAGTILLSVFPATHALSAYVPTLQWSALVATITGHALPATPNTPLAEDRAHASRRMALLAKTTRDRVSGAMTRDLTVFGKGLGAPLGNLDPRDPEGYGFEQSYLNLMHKFGIFAGYIFFALGLMAWRTWRALQFSRTRHFAFGAMALFAGLVMAYGNPTLMSPVMVTLQCVVLYWMRPDDRDAATGWSLRL
jgi:hypothetical protein